jgi:hypothetical protein
VLALGADVLVDPAHVRFVLRERADEVLARHAGLAHADRHDLALEAAHVVDVAPEVCDERVEHLRRELQLHELLGEALARTHDLGFAGAARGGEALGDGVVESLDRTETACRLLGIRAGVDGLFFVLGLVLGFFVFEFGLFLAHDRLRVMRLRDLVRRIRVEEADDEVRDAALAGLDRLEGGEQVVVGRRVVGEGGANLVEAFFDALGDADLALARQELDRAHLAHVHAHRVGGASELGVGDRECRGRFLDRLFVGCGSIRQQQRFGIRCLFVNRDAHVVDGVDDVFDLLGIDDLGRQVVVDLRIGQVALFLAACDEQLQLRLAVFRDDRELFLAQSVVPRGDVGRPQNSRALYRLDVGFMKRAPPRQRLTAGPRAPRSP